MEWNVYELEAPNDAASMHPYQLGFDRGGVNGGAPRLALLDVYSFTDSIFV